VSVPYIDKQRGVVNYNHPATIWYATYSVPLPSRVVVGIVWHYQPYWALTGEMGGLGWGYLMKLT
jgi:hypothetical protein